MSKLKEALDNYNSHFCAEHRGDLSICCCGGELHPCLLCENFALKSKLAQLGHPVSKEPISTNHSGLLPPIESGCQYCDKKEDHIHSRPDNIDIYLARELAADRTKEPK